MQSQGFTVDATDGSAGMVAEARKVGVDARVASFEELDDVARYDGVFASFSLLHAPRSEMPDLLARIARSLKPRGCFYIGVKTGEGEHRDSLGRLYVYHTIPGLIALLDGAGFYVLEQEEGEEVGFAGTLDPFVQMLCRKRT
jgi:SAM-dependent methyltransferase